MFHVHDEYRKMIRIPARAFNYLAKFCNNLTVGWGLTIRRPDVPSHGDPVKIEIDPMALSDAGYAVLPIKQTDESDTDYAARATPEDVVNYDEDETDAEKVARVGTSNEAARADHKHMMPFGINPLADGDDAANNVPSEDVYVPDEDEDTSDLDLSGTSPFAARADHTHLLNIEGGNVTNLEVYQIYKPDGTSHYWAVPYTLKFVNGILKECVEGSEFDLFQNGTPNSPTVS